MSQRLIATLLMKMHWSCMLQMFRVQLIKPYKAEMVRKAYEADASCNQVVIDSVAYLLKSSLSSEMI